MSNLLGVISCPENSTQANLVAQVLRRAARNRGLEMSLEIRRGSQIEQRLSASDLSCANAVLLVGEGEFEGERFGSLPSYHASLTAALDGPDDVINQVLARLQSAPSNLAQTEALSIVAITACPTGIAHTFMAAEGLALGAKKLGHTIKVETQGSVGVQQQLSTEDISHADLVIIAADTQINLERFAGKRVYVSSTKEAISHSTALIATAILQAKVMVVDKNVQSNGLKMLCDTQRTGPYKHLMTGMSFMLPFVVSGGILIALAFALGGIYVFDETHKGSLGWALFEIGAKSAFTLMVPILAGFIAYSIADRPGIAPGMVGGTLAVSMGSGFLGGIIAGFIAGYLTHWLNRLIKLPRHLEGMKPVVVLPILGVLGVGLLMVYVVNAPVAGVYTGLIEWLKSMQGSSALLLGAVIGAMMAFDMGGPVNKAAYTFSTGLLASQIYTPLGAAMVAGMTPPLGVALATWLFANRFNKEEREAGKAAAVLGLSFITEGAIPFAARDPLRVIPIFMIGSAIAGGLAMGFGVGLHAPHGGIFLLLIPDAVTHLSGFLLCLMVGSVVTALLLRMVVRRHAIA